ncbi:glycosyltransferase family 61 protein [Isoptericola sp. NPDC019693]|uniref:glycosyltransferase family 61 protein n=1 Tax=Isoptericola sp. NPDC019693 TaxID=3364009 RepID=UPI003795BC81
MVDGAVLLVGPHDEQPRRAMIVTDPASGGMAATEALASRLEGFDVTVVRVGVSPERDRDPAHDSVTVVDVPDLAAWASVTRRLPAPDLVIDLTEDGKDVHARVWRRGFLNLRQGGVHLVRHRAGAGPLEDSCARVVHRAVGAVGRGVAEKLPDPRDRALAASVETLTLAPTHTVVVKRGVHHLKVRESEVGKVVAGRSSDVTAQVVARRAAGTLRSPTRVHGALPRDGELATSVAYPAATVRVYEGPVTVAPRGLVHAAGMILPESFRYPYATTLTSPGADDVDAAFARVPARHRAVRHLPGTYFHLDPFLASHFGHLMVETVPRLWGWGHVRALYPDAKVILQARTPGDRVSTLDRRLLGAYGIDAEDVVVVDGPVRVDRLAGASPLLHYAEPYSIHPSLVSTWDRLADTLVRPEIEGHGERIFVSRPAGRMKRDCRNTDEVEEIFRGFGFTVVHPEVLSLQEQASAFARAKVIAGFGGSGMLSLIYARQVETVIVLNQEGYTARNEYVVSLLLDCDVHFLWSAGDVPQPDEGWSSEAFFSAWDFDVERNIDELRGLLGSS